MFTLRKGGRLELYSLQGVKKNYSDKWAATRINSKNIN